MRILVLLVVTTAMLVLVAQGILRCFAPQTLRQIQLKLRPGDKSRYQGAGWTFFDRLADKDANNPTLMSRVLGLVEVAIALYVLTAMFIR